MLLVLWARATLGGGFAPELSILLWLFAFGALIGIPRATWLPVLVAVPALAELWLDAVVWFTPHPHPLPTPVELTPALPLIGVTLLGASWDPLSRGLARLRAARPATLLWTLNALNVTDALLTTFVLRHDQAVEANPVIRLIGLPRRWSWSPSPAR